MFGELFIIYMVLFISGCFIGYLLEVTYRRIMTGKFVNPGFMKGPWLPIYGLGLILMFTICLLIVTLLPDELMFYNPTGTLFWKDGVRGPSIADLIPIFLMGSGMILLEFIAGLIFIKGFKIRLWDYTNMKGNIMGIICPQFNVIWVLVAAIYYYGINPFVFSAFIDLYDFVHTESMASVITHFGFSFTLGAVYGIFVLDLVKSLGIFKKIVKATKGSKVSAAYFKLREAVSRSISVAGDAIPDAIKETGEAIVDRSKREIANLTTWLRKLNYIDPDKKTADDEYDENGRPKKIEE